MESASLPPIELNFQGPFGVNTVIGSSGAFSGISFDIGLYQLLSKKSPDPQAILRDRTKCVSPAKE